MTSTAGTSDGVDRLNAGFGKRGAVHFAESPLGGIVAELNAGGARAVVALQGGQVLSYVPAEGREGRDVLWVSPPARLGTGKAVRGGIPVCWPWFGPHPSDPSQPAHGFVRTVPWNVARTAGTADAARVVLSCPFPPDRRLAWAGRAELTLEVALTDRLRLTLATRNLSDEALPLTEALHTYLAIGDVDAVSVGGLDGHDYIDKLDRNLVKQQIGGIRFSAEVDRIYADAGPMVTVMDGAWNRRIQLTKDGSASTVVWNPWIAKSERLGDMGPDGYRRMVCVETANCGDVLVTVPPGGTHEMSVTLAASKA